jgi:hypothetical protein
LAAVRWSPSDSVLAAVGSGYRQTLVIGADRIAALDNMRAMLDQRVFGAEPMDPPAILLASLDSAEAAFGTDAAMAREIRRRKVLTLLELGRTREALTLADREGIDEPGPIAFASGMLPEFASGIVERNAAAMPAHRMRAAESRLLSIVRGEAGAAVVPATVGTREPATAPGDPERATIDDIMEAWQLALDGKTDAAITLFGTHVDRIAGTDVPDVLHIPLLEYAILLAGQPATRRRGLDWLEWIALGGRSPPRCCLQIPARTAIAEALDAAGDTEAAIRQYRNLLQLLEDADAEHEPRRLAARAAIDRLVNR